MKCLNCLLLILGVIIQESDSILIEREDFDFACSNINRLIKQGVGPIEAAERATKELQIKKGHNLDEPTGSFNKKAHQVVQSADGRINWLFSVFSSILQSQAVKVQVGDTNSTKVGVFGKRESPLILQIPCELIPFPSVVDSTDGQSIKLMLLSIDHFLNENRL
ncbi:uncharacterized protein LOC107362062 [Tetranychus urticae]|uniref:Uncharacterized protein n=1 Tax=Tetranychus urticae TaxID=32264 RepID=T1JQX6_TETUR|nr:uncharacterized protein LOC107362062 [Tetranychus urticae]